MKIFLMGPLDADLEAIAKQLEDHESNISPPWINPLISPQLRMSKNVVFSLSLLNAAINNKCAWA